MPPHASEIPFPPASSTSQARRRVLRFGLTYGLLTLLAMGGYGLFVAGVSLVLGPVFEASHPVLVGLGAFGIALAFHPLRERVQTAIDRAFFREKPPAPPSEQDFHQQLAMAADPETISGLLRRSVQTALSPVSLHIFLYDPVSDQFVPAPGEHGQATTDLRFAAKGGLAQALAQGTPDALSGALSVPAAAQVEAHGVTSGNSSGPGRRRPALDAFSGLPEGEQARLSLLGCSLIAPLRGRQGLAGWLALGKSASAEPYPPAQLALLAGLLEPAGLALERLQLAAAMQRRVGELEALTRLSQGINFTVSFDDILELIYAQTNQAIPTRDFRITLFDPQTGVYYHRFYLQDNERLADRENRPFDGEQGLEAEVLDSRKAVITDDYRRECRRRGCVPGEEGILAWMGAPMNTGAETIGVISLASRDPAVTFTDEQCALLQAIADQASGAIVKARLLQESEERAHQLASLNEIGRSLTSTLELKPLLKNILNSATEILNCEAGSLFLVDEATGELLAEAVTGAEAGPAGKRLPPGNGVVGEAVERGLPVIANDPRRRKDWGSPDGSQAQDRLAAPMQVKERVIGVIELINKASGMPFTPADLEMLATFSSQATIAIENARLYTLTDQALAARVEELSMMQRIDRELNASLDVGRSLQLTLEWAMRQSRADAGLVGMLEEDRLRIMASSGLPDAGEQAVGAPDLPSSASILETNRSSSGTAPGSQSGLPAGQGAVQRILSSGRPELTLRAGRSAGHGYFSNDRVSSGAGAPPEGEICLIPEGLSQVAVPIRREEAVIGALLLESRSPEAWTQEDLDFLTRLTDHAAIAIANAQLYAEVQAANLSKSKFVSFVAHELKNPMSSIKGYTELVANGMAGPVNEMQASFLGTVRSNVERMNTIVSDLNDLTKIQVGSLRLEFRPVSVHELTAEITRSFRRQFEEKSLRFEVALAEDLPQVWGDPVRMAQILTNLVSNAVKYTKTGGLISVGAERWAPVETAGPVDRVHLWVQDTGIGISPEDQPRIFEQYFRTEISKEAATGTGLGLNITRSLVEMQGGQIWFESELGTGTRFHFTVPVAEGNHG